MKVNKAREAGASDHRGNVVRRGYRPRRGLDVIWFLIPGAPPGFTLTSAPRTETNERPIKGN